MGELGNVDRADAASTKEGGPVVLEVFVEDAVADIVGEQVLDLDGSAETEGDFGVDTVDRSDVSSGIEE